MNLKDALKNAALSGFVISNPHLLKNRSAYIEAFQFRTPVMLCHAGPIVTMGHQIVRMTNNKLRYSPWVPALDELIRDDWECYELVEGA